MKISTGSSLLPQNLGKSSVTCIYCVEPKFNCTFNEANYKVLAPSKVSKYVVIVTGDSFGCWNHFLLKANENTNFE